MMDSLRIVVHRSNIIFEDIVLTLHSVYMYNEYIKTKSAISKSTSYTNGCNLNKKTRSVPLNTNGFNAYLVSAYIVTLKNSYMYRSSAINVLLTFLNVLSEEVCNKVILIKLRTPKKQFLDYKWNEKLSHMVTERREADHAMSWLSTLGGAFSALGEEFQHCAEIAGKISVRQFQLALQLGNPLLVARCKLYAALSLIQQGHLKAPQHIVRKIYQLAVHEQDIRLQNMCQGIWAKLKYCYKLRRQQKMYIKL